MNPSCYEAVAVRQGELKDALAKIKPFTTVKATATAILGKNSSLACLHMGLWALAFH